MRETFGSVILAGGKSERMGFPKIYLEAGGKTFVRKIAETYSRTEIKICLVINKEYAEGTWKSSFEDIKALVSVVEKTDSSYGRFHSLKLGIKNLLNCDFIFIQNADNPFVDDETIETLKQNKNSFGYTQLICNGKKAHPVLVSKKVAEKINDISNEDFNLRDVLKKFPKREAETNNQGSLANINTQVDYAKYF